MPARVNVFGIAPLRTVCGFPSTALGHNDADAAGSICGLGLTAGGTQLLPHILFNR